MHVLVLSDGIEIWIHVNRHGVRPHLRASGTMELTQAILIFQYL